jgi:ADP-ribose pyrophosphatase YjhB (NUDIX family)
MENIILAAGGIVWRRISGEYKIALVCKKRNNISEWSLPKGKLIEGESWQDAAMREAEEETGQSVRILAFADTISYHADNTPKVVSYWHMYSTGTFSKLPDPAEISEVDWYSIEDATEILTYPEQKNLIRHLSFPGSRIKLSIRNLFSKINFRNFIRSFLNRARVERLKGDLQTYIAELEFADSKHAGNDKTPNWAEQTKLLIKQSQTALKNGEIDIGWKNFHAAKRMQMNGFSNNELTDAANTIRFEAEKLNEWRRKAIFNLIGDHDRPVQKLKASTLITAAKIRDEHYHNVYYKNALVSKVFGILMLLLFLWIILITIFFNQTDLGNLIITDNNMRSVSLFSMILGVILFGLLGSTVSALFHFRDSSRVTRIPEIVSNNFITFVRVCVGAGSALLIFVFLESDFSGLFIQNIDLQPTNAYTYFTLAFIAGFTERLLLNAISSIVGKE